MLTPYKHISKDQLIKMARHTRKRAELCVKVVGGHFEHFVHKVNVFTVIFCECSIVY